MPTANAELDPDQPPCGFFPPDERFKSVGRRVLGAPKLLARGQRGRRVPGSADRAPPRGTKRTLRKKASRPNQRLQPQHFHTAFIGKKKATWGLDLDPRLASRNVSGSDASSGTFRSAKGPPRFAQKKRASQKNIGDGHTGPCWAWTPGPRRSAPSASPRRTRPERRSIFGRLFGARRRRTARG